MTERTENLQKEIDFYNENRKYALQAQKEIDDLKVTYDKIGHRIEELQIVYDSEVEKNRSLESTVSEEGVERVRQERLSIRPGIEKEFHINKGEIKFRLEADKIDKKLGCTIVELSDEQDFAIKPKFRRQTIE